MCLQGDVGTKLASQVTDNKEKGIESNDSNIIVMLLSTREVTKKKVPANSPKGIL